MAETKQRTAEEIVAGLREQLESLRERALAEIGNAEERATEQEQRYWTAREELEEARTHLREAREEYEALPMRSHTARMKGQEDHERQLNERYRALDAEVPQVEERIRGLTAEVDYLCSGSRRLDPQRGAALQARIPLDAEATRQGDELEALRGEIEDLLDEMLEPVLEKTANIQQQVAGLSTSIRGQFQQAGHRSAAEISSHGDADTAPEYPPDTFVLISDYYALSNASYLKGDLVHLDEGPERERLLGSGSAVRPDSEVGQLLLSGQVDEAMKLHLQSMARGHIVHGPSENMNATPSQKPQEESATRPEDDPEELERMYSQGPDWAAIRGRQNQPLPPRGPKADE